MKDYYCLDLKFKDTKISDKTYHSHLYVADDKMYFQIIDNDEKSDLDRRFFSSKNSLSLFENNFEVVGTEVSIMFDNSRIYKATSFDRDAKNQFFTIYVSRICLVKQNIHKEYVNEGVAFLNKNGLQIVNLFYSFFTNLADKNKFKISRMNGMSDYYEIKNMSFRPELEFSSNEKRGSSELTIKKKPTIDFKFENIEYEQIQQRLKIICNFLSFCYGIRIIMEKLVFRTESDIYFFRDTEPNNKTYVSDTLHVFEFLEENYKIEKILKTDWFSHYEKKEKQITKAIDNFLHSREVNLGAAFLLLFNIIEIFNVNHKQDKFKFNTTKSELVKETFKNLKPFLDDNEDEKEFEKKVKVIIDKLEFKPQKSPLEETLKINNIDPLFFGFSFTKLKNTRDNITHGSLKKIKEKELQSQVACLRKITTCLILSNLGLTDDLRKNAT